MSEILRYKVKVVEELAPRGVEEALVDISDIIDNAGVGTIIAGDSATYSGDVEITGNLTVTGDATLDTVAAGVATVDELIDSGLTATRAVYTDGSKQLVSAPAGVTTTFTTVTSVDAITVVNGLITALTITGA